MPPPGAAFPDRGKVQHRVDQARAAAWSDVPGLGAQRHPGGSARSFGDDHLGGGDGAAIVADLEVLMPLMPGHVMPPVMVQDPDAAGSRPGVRIGEPVPPGAPAGGGDAGRRSDCTAHSAVVSASNRRKGRDSAAALPSSAAATRSSAAAGQAVSAIRYWAVKLTAAAAAASTHRAAAALRRSRRTAAAVRAAQLLPAVPGAGRGNLRRLRADG